MFNSLTNLGGLLITMGRRVDALAAYRKAHFGPIRQSNGSPEFNQLCQAVRDRTGSGDVLIYLFSLSTPVERPQATITAALSKSCGNTRETFTLLI